MSKELICLVFFILVLGLAGYVSATEVDVKIPGAGSQKPILDGVVDSVWLTTTEQFLTITLEGSDPSSPDDCSGSWRALWDSAYLYVLIDVDDEALVQDSDPTTGWHDDRIEVFIDGDNSKDSSYDMKNDYQYCFRWNHGEVETPHEHYFRATAHPAGSSLEGVEYAVVTTDDGYLFEIALPWLTMTGEPSQLSQLIGIDVTINDDDDGSDRDTQISWYTETPSVHVPSKWGTALLVLGADKEAVNPDPTDGQTGVPCDAILRWTQGIYAAKHNVYFGTVFDDVNQASTADPRGVLVGESQDDTTYGPAGVLGFGQTYYWRVDEVNAPPDSAVYKGEVWSFTTVNFIIVDDFESYNDLDTTNPNSNRIFLTWLDGLDQPTNGSIVGYADPPFAEQSIVYGGEQSMPLAYDNDMKYSEAQRTLSGSASDWTREGVDSLTLWFRGNPAYVGGFVEAPAGTYTMTASGTDIWSDADEFHFAYKEFSGAGAIIAEVESVENTDPWAKAGVMIRDTLEPDSRNAALLVTPENGVRFQYRKTAGDSTERYFAEGITAPQWVKLERTTGGLVRAFYSADGSTWTLLNMAVVSMDMPVYIGLAVTSHNVDATCEAKFSHVSFGNSSVGPQWTDQDVGMLSNDAQPMYVVLNGIAVVYHEDPGATQIDTWTQWNIPLQSFADQGVDLTNVNTIGIGFGDRNNPQAGGSGLMYFDDIRLYLPR